MEKSFQVLLYVISAWFRNSSSFFRVIWIFITVRGDVRWRGRVSLFKRRIYVNVHIIKILKYCRLSIPSGFKRHVFESTFISLCRCWFDSTRRYIGKDLIDVFNPDLKLGTVSCLRSSSSIIGFLHSFFFKKEKFSIVPRTQLRLKRISRFYHALILKETSNPLVYNRVPTTYHRFRNGWGRGRRSPLVIPRGAFVSAATWNWRFPRRYKSRLDDTNCVHVSSNHHQFPIMLHVSTRSPRCSESYNRCRTRLLSNFQRLLVSWNNFIKYFY